MREAIENREAQAAREVGHTDVSRGVALGLAGAFGLLLLAVLALEVGRDVARSGTPWAELRAGLREARLALGSSPLAANRRLLAGMSAFEDALEDRSAVTGHALPPVQYLLTEHLRVGNEQVVLGSRGWLYFRPALDYLTGPGFLDPARLARAASAGEGRQPQPDPLPAIADFGAQLAEQGIGLVVVVTPVKAALHPEGLEPALAGADLPLENPSFGRFLERLAEMEIPAYAPGPRLAEALRERGWPQFLRTDTHWTTHAMENAAEGLAGFLVRHVALAERRPVAYERHQAWVEGSGDLVALLKLPRGARPFPAERVLTRPVVGPEGEPWAPDPHADVLLLGDSFTNIYSLGTLGWGDAAGLAEQLSHVLDRPVDRLVQNDEGAFATRAMLARVAMTDPERLARTRVVVWQFAARELAFGDWRLIDLVP